MRRKGCVGCRWLPGPGPGRLPTQLSATNVRVRSKNGQFRGMNVLRNYGRGTRRIYNVMRHVVLWGAVTPHRFSRFLFHFFLNEIANDLFEELNAGLFVKSVYLS